MNKYLHQLLSQISVAFEYRVNTIGYLLMEILGVVSVIVIWTAVFRDVPEVGGYDRMQLILYYFLAPLVAFTTGVHLSQYMANEIKEGKISPYLLKPYTFWLRTLARDIGSKTGVMVSVVPVYTVLLIVFFTLNPGLFVLPSFLIGLVFMVSAFFLSFWLDFAVTMLAFWFDEVWSFAHFKQILINTFGGLLFPLSFFPDSVERIVNLSPFRFLFYVPLQYLSGQKGLAEAPQDFGVLILWILVLAGLQTFLWKRGVRRYGAFGN